MLDIIKPAKDVVSVLDFGCGTAHLYEYILNNNIQGIKYSGLDISDKFYQLCLKKFPDINFLKMDVMEDSALPVYDYILMNGVFTEKVNLDYEEMMIYFQALIKEVFPKCIFGTAFNVMSDNVDWQRDDLFHLPLGVLKEFLINSITDNYEIRDDYGLYEYTVYLYK
ncbi:MAG: class I SAM-dependent methyltransferase [Romboutsia sp.]|nr:class I SAM-dependent methyltransferase [Romboutsia sp.]